MNHANCRWCHYHKEEVSTYVHITPCLYYISQLSWKQTLLETVKWIAIVSSSPDTRMSFSGIKMPIHLPTPCFTAMLLSKSGHEIPRTCAHAWLCTGVKLAQTLPRQPILPCLLHHHPAICPPAVEAGDSSTGWPTLLGMDIWVD